MDLVMHPDVRHIQERLQREQTKVEGLERELAKMEGLQRELRGMGLVMHPDVRHIQERLQREQNKVEGLERELAKMEGLQRELAKVERFERGLARMERFGRLLRELRSVRASALAAMDEDEDRPPFLASLLRDLHPARASAPAAMFEVGDLSYLENPDTVSAFVNRVARKQNDYRRKNKELRVTAPLEYRFLDPLLQMGFNIIEKIAPTYIVLRKDKSRAEEDDSQKRTILTSANDLHEDASNATLMQRENIASSSNPCNLRSSQIPLAVAQTPVWESACEQDSGFQHSSRAFSSGPVVWGFGIEAAGLRGFSAGPETAVQTKRRPHPANESDGLPGSKRTRRPDFLDEEKGFLLQANLEYLQDSANEEKRHKWLVRVTEEMKDNGYNRDPQSLRGLWDNLKKGRDALRRSTPQGTSYWDLTMDQKKAIKKDQDHHFPLTFEREWYDVMEKIEKLDPVVAVEKETRGDGQEDRVFSQSFKASTMTGSANFAAAGSSDANNQEFHEETGDEPDSESEATDVPTGEEVLSGESGASDESAAFASDEDSRLFAKIGPFVNQQIEAALLPLISALRSREEDEHKHRQKMLALEREKLALMRQKLESRVRRP